MNIIELSGVTKTFGSVVAVDNLSLDVPKGSIYGFIGPNGSGKTTLFRLLTGQEVEEAGVVSIPGGTTIGYFNQKVGEMSGCSPVEQAVRCAGRVAGACDRLFADYGPVGHAVDHHISDHSCAGQRAHGDCGSGVYRADGHRA